MILRNPSDTARIDTVVDRQRWVIEPGDILNFDDPKVAEELLNRYQFLQEVDDTGKVLRTGTQRKIAIDPREVIIRPDGTVVIDGKVYKALSEAQGEAITIEDKTMKSVPQEVLDKAPFIVREEHKEEQEVPQTQEKEEEQSDNVETNDNQEEKEETPVKKKKIKKYSRKKKTSKKSK